MIDDYDDENVRFDGEPSTGLDAALDRMAYNAWREHFGV